ncbi:MAG: GNAT family N-acetyltransferase [Bacteroidota bacterium]
MEEAYQIVYVEKPEELARNIIGFGIHNYNEQQVGDNRFQRLCFVVTGPDKVIVGGVIGATYWDWLYVDLLWVKEELRGRGYGHQLLTQIEEEARRRGARHAYLDTFSFQAPDFYEQHGYRIFGKLENFPSGHQRYFLTKEL